MKNLSQPKGLRSQNSLFRWFRTTVTMQVAVMTSQSSSTTRFNTAVRAVQKLLQDGWKLEMSGENSPADKSGIDFVWANSRLDAWFPLDTTYKDKVGTPSLIHLVRLTDVEDVIAGRLSHETNVEFLELLVGLAQKSVALSLRDLPPPEMATVANLRQSLESFKARLAKVGARPGYSAYLEWAAYLNGAINYQAKADTGRFNVDLGLIESAINEAVKAFLNARKGGCPDFDRGSFQRGKHISYSETADTLHVSDPVNPVWPGIRDRVQLVFDKEYAELVKLEKGGLDLLLITKQMFSAQGAAWVIHHILDVIEAKSDGRAINVQPKMMALVPASVPARVPARVPTTTSASVHAPTQTRAAKVPAKAVHAKTFAAIASMCLTPSRVASA